jgi:hypothetical protein
MGEILKYLFFAIALLSLGRVAFSQKSYKSYKQFKAKDYPETMFKIRRDSAHFLNYSIELIHVLNVSYPGIQDATSTEIDPNFFDCRGWLFLKKGEKVAHTIYYSNMNAVGGCSGVYIPAVQPRKDYFLVVKNGDYDGNIIIIDSTGNITKEKGGGSIQVSSDKRYMFADYDSDEPGITIYDFEKHKTLFTPDSPEVDSNLKGQFQIGAWYYQDNKYMARVYTDAEEGENPDTLHISVATYDFKKNMLIYSKKDKGFLKSTNALQDYDYYEYSDGMANCNCGR